MVDARRVPKMNLSLQASGAHLWYDGSIQHFAVVKCLCPSYLVASDMFGFIYPKQYSDILIHYHYILNITRIPVAIFKGPTCQY